MQVKKATKRSPEGLENPNEFPTPLGYVWSSFVSLNSARTGGFSGPNPITYQEIQAWKELTNAPITPREVDAIKRLDKAYLNAA